MLDSTLSDSPGRAPLGQTWHPASVARALVTSVSSVVHGHDGAVEVVAALLAGGHVLVEDVPGSGKTTLARAFARSVGGSFRRVQATADLLPGRHHRLRCVGARRRLPVRPRPVFANVCWSTS